MTSKAGETTRRDRMQSQFARLDETHRPLVPPARWPPATPANQLLALHRAAGNQAIAHLGSHQQARRMATGGLAGPAERLPFLDQLQASFGPHDLSGVRSFMGRGAADAAWSLGAAAYTTSNSVVFGQDPDLHLAAHEAAHIVQQRAMSSTEGTDLSPELRASHEANAERVAERVTRGESAVDLLDAGAVQSGPLRATPAVVQLYDGGDLIESFAGGFAGFFDSVGRGARRSWEGSLLGAVTDPDRFLEVTQEDERFIRGLFALLEWGLPVVDDALNVALLAYETVLRDQVLESLGAAGWATLRFSYGFAGGFLANMVARTLVERLFDTVIPKGPWFVAIQALKVQGLLDKASEASRRLDRYQPLFSSVLREQNMDMFWFAIEEEVVTHMADARHQAMEALGIWLPEFYPEDWRPQEFGLGSTVYPSPIPDLETQRIRRESGTVAGGSRVTRTGVVME